MNPLEPHTGRGPMSRPLSDANQRMPMLPGVPGFVDGTPSEPPGLSTAPTMTSLLQAFRRRWALALALGIVGAVIGVGAVLVLFPPKFTAFSLVEVGSRPDPLVLNENHQPEDFVLFKARMQSFVKSSPILNLAINYDPEIKDLAIVRDSNFVEWLEGNLKTDYLRGPDILKIALGMDNADEAARVVNAVTGAFLKEIEQRDKKRRQEVLTELSINYANEERKLDQKRRELQKRQMAAGVEDIMQLKERYTAAFGELSQIKAKERDARYARQKSEQEIQNLEARIKDPANVFVPPDQINDALEKDPDVQTLLLERSVIQKRIFDISSKSVNPESAVRQEQANLDKLDKRINEVRERNTPALVAKLRTKIHGEMQSDVANLKGLLEYQAKHETDMGREVKKQEEHVKALNPANRPETFDLMLLREDVDKMDLAMPKLKEKIALIAMEPSAAARVRLLQTASPPAGRDISRQTKMAGAAGLGMFGLLVFGVSWLEFRARRVGSTEDVVQGLGLSLVGTVPAVPERQNRPSANGTGSKDLYWQSQLSEAVDSIRTMLLHASRKESLKVVMVTSAVSGEGKTSLASQLAASLARAWRKTLLVDGDLRNPSAHKLFELPQEPGLSEALRGEVQVADTIKPTLLSRLWLMPAGHWDSHAVQALAQDEAKNLIHELETQFDFIIVDTSPILPVADTLLLAQHVDAAIFSILRNVSRLPAVYAAQQKLANLGIRVLGAVVLGTDAEGGYMGYGNPARAG